MTLGALSRQRRKTAAATILYFSSTPSLTLAALNTIVITGTTRTEGPPRPILGPRVAKYVCEKLEQRGHKITAILDPLEMKQSDDPDVFPLLEKPHFAYSKSQVPAKLEQIAQQLESADCFVTITPEYNHAPSPALLNILNHFGSSKFSFKPSAIVSYSAGQWGGTRAAIALRPILSELGCLPVSAMIHIPETQTVLDEKGHVIGEETTQQRWDSYVDRCFSQLEWWGEAAKKHRTVVDPLKVSPAFATSPTQRNAP